MKANESPLFLACQEFVKESLSYLRRYIEDTDRLPLTTKIKFDEDGGYSSVPYPYLSLLVQKHMDQLTILPQFKLCEDLMNADPNAKAHMNKNIGTHFIGLMRDSWHYLSFMLFSVLDIYYETGRFRKSLFKNAFDSFEQFVSSKSFKVLIVAPLVNFESEDINSIQIDKKIRIRKVTNDDKANLIEATGSLGISRMNVFQFKYVIEYETVADKSTQVESGTGFVDVRSVLDEIITTMRLFKRGNISYNLLWSKSVLDFPGIAGGIQENTLGRYNYAPPQYSLSKKEARNLATLCKR